MRIIDIPRLDKREVCVKQKIDPVHQIVVQSE